MKFLNKNSNTLLCGLLFLITILCYGFKFINGNAFIGTLASVATIYYGTLKLKIENDLIFKDLFKSFNERYDDQINDLINGLRLDESIELEHDHKKLIIDYFNLCAEEFLWKRKGRIPNDVWIAWRAGIMENLKIKQIRELFEKETETKNGKASYYGLYEELAK
ncbi:hypothetical protein [Pedobacter polysacchareus]|uniref:hypothetical protein n=1 Tax=Pedobacter polysacchareus TaxID=2861973 RepID=UPI001C995992|nr:hypothetical protein [Pedobacter polysacchareus]